MNLEWQLETAEGNWVTEKFEPGKLPSPINYIKAVLMYTQPLETLITFAIVNVHGMRLWVPVVEGE